MRLGLGCAFFPHKKTWHLDLFGLMSSVSQPGWFRESGAAAEMRGNGPGNCPKEGILNPIVKNPSAGAIFCTIPWRCMGDKPTLHMCKACSVHLWKELVSSLHPETDLDLARTYSVYLFSALEIHRLKAILPQNSKRTPFPKSQKSPKLSLCMVKSSPWKWICFSNTAWFHFYFLSNRRDNFNTCLSNYTSTQDHIHLPINVCLCTLDNFLPPTPPSPAPHTHTVSPIGQNPTGHLGILPQCPTDQSTPAYDSNIVC